MNIFKDFQQWQLSLLSGLCIGLSYHPPLHLGFLAWIGFIPLLHILFNSPPKSAARYAYFTSVTANLIAFHWIGLNSGAGWIPVTLSLAGAVLYLGIFWAIFGAVISATRGHRLVWAVIPLAWISLEWVRSLGPLGFPWANLALTQSQYLPLLQILDVTGTYGVSLWVLILNIGAYLALLTGQKVRYFSFLAGLLILLAGQGFIRMNTIESILPERQVSVSVTQPNLDPNKKWDQANRARVFKLMDSLQVVAIEQKPDFILWPETALPAYLKLSYTSRQQVQRRVIASGIPLLSGTVDKDWDENGNARYYNGSIMLYPRGDYRMYYKAHLVPFAEYIPGSEIFPILKKLNFGQGNFTQGSEYTVFGLDSVRFSNIICYESSMPDLVRRFVAAGAQFITIEANDGYLGNSAGPYQHFELARLRAIENRVPIVRSANTGISGVFDAVGRTVEKVPIGQQKIFKTVIFVTNHESWYTDHGEVFAIACTLLSLLILGVIGWKEKSKR